MCSSGVLIRSRPAGATRWALLSSATDLAGPGDGDDDPPPVPAAAAIPPSITKTTAITSSSSPGSCCCSAVGARASGEIGRRDASSERCSSASAPSISWRVSSITSYSACITSTRPCRGSSGSIGISAFLHGEPQCSSAGSCSASDQKWRGHAAARRSSGLRHLQSCRPCSVPLRAWQRCMARLSCPVAARRPVKRYRPGPGRGNLPNRMNYTLPN